MINFSKDDVVFFLKGRLIFVAGVAIILVSVSGFFFRDRIAGFFRVKSVEYKTPDVSTPTIVGGELILPKVMLDQFNPGSAKESQLHALSANLFGVFDGSEQQVVPPKLVGIRIMGEVQNVGKTIVQEFSPVVRFLDVDNKEIAKKVGRVTSGFDFFGVLPNAKTLYDVIVDNPPEADKMEIILNTMSATTSAKFDVLKVINKAIIFAGIENIKLDIESKKKFANLFMVSCISILGFMVSGKKAVIFSDKIALSFVALIIVE